MKSNTYPEFIKSLLPSIGAGKRMGSGDVPQRMKRGP
jgi:hypothetical protein